MKKRPPVKVNKFARRLVDSNPEYFITTVTCGVCGDNLVVHKYRWNGKGQVLYGLLCSGHLLVTESPTCKITALDGKRMKWPRAEPRKAA